MVNEVFLMGRLGKDPEVKYTQAQKAFCQFSLAVENYKGETDWFEITVWDKQAENFGKYCKKGSLIFVRGSLMVDTYTTKDGRQVRNTKVAAREIKFLSHQQNAQQSHKRNTTPYVAPQTDFSTDFVPDNDTEEDLPF